MIARLYDGPERGKVNEDISKELIIKLHPESKLGVEKSEHVNWEVG